MRLSRSFIFDSFSFIAKSCCLILHIVWNLDSSFPSTIGFFPRAFATLTPVGRVVPSSAKELSFHLLESMINMNRPHTSSFWSFLHFYLKTGHTTSGHCEAPSKHVQGWTSFCGCWRRFRGHVWFLWLLLHTLHKTCTLSHWSCANVVYSVMPLFCHTQQS